MGDRRLNEVSCRRRTDENISSGRPEVGERTRGNLSHAQKLDRNLDDGEPILNDNFALSRSSAPDRTIWDDSSAISTLALVRNLLHLCPARTMVGSPAKRRRLDTRPAEPEDDDDAVLSLDVASFERPEDEDADSDAEVNSQDGDGAEEQGDSEDDWSADESEASRGRSLGSTTPTRQSSRSTSRAGTPSRKTPTKRKSTPSKKARASTGPFVRLTASDAYFTAMSRPAKTSSNVFSNLLPPLTHVQYTSLLRTSKGAQQHEFAIEDLEHAHEVRWPGWLRELGEGFNVLCYGLGSKRDVLNKFAQDVLVDHGNVVVVNGVFPRLGIRDVLAAIESAIPGVHSVPPPPASAQSTPIDALAFKIYTHFLPLDLKPAPAFPLAEDDLYILIHGIDSAGLRTAQARSILSLLASSPRIHLVASIDHIQAPIMFSNSETHGRPHAYPSGWTGTIPSSRGFNWLYHDLTTLRPYDAEVAYRISTASRLPTTGGGAGLATEEGARHILTSVTDLARRLFKALARTQMDSMTTSSSGSSSSTANQSSGQGSTTPTWSIETALFFTLCKEKWISREETRFKALLLEFKDHKLVVESTSPPAGLEADQDEGRKGRANARWLWIPLGREALSRLVEELVDVPE
jgi:origin recognition complex subunit 2